MGYTSTYDASHKVSAGGSHVQGFMRHIGREADEQAGFHFKHSNLNIDPSRTSMNDSMVNDGQGWFRAPVSVDGKPPSNEFESYLDERLSTVKKPLRKNAVKIRPLVLQLDPQWFRENNPDWKTEGLNAEAGKLVQTQLDWACSEFGQKNIVGFSLHMDEAHPQLQVMMTTVTDDGRLSQRDFFAGPADLCRQRSELNDALEAEGYDVERTPTARSKEHLSSSEFQAKADRVAAAEAEAAMDAAALETMTKSLEIRKGSLDDRESRLEDRELKVNRRSSKLDERADELAVREVEVSGKTSDAAELALEAQRAIARFEEREERLAAMEARSQGILDRMEEREKLLQQSPPDFERFLDTPMKGGTTLRTMFDKRFARPREIRAGMVKTSREEVSELMNKPTPGEAPDSDGDFGG